MVELSYYLTKINFYPKLIKRDKEVHFIPIKEKSHQDDISDLNVYAPNTKTPMYVKEAKLHLKSYIKPHTIIVGDITTHFYQQTKSLL